MAASGRSPSAALYPLLELACGAHPILLAIPLPQAKRSLGRNPL